MLVFHSLDGFYKTYAEYSNKLRYFDCLACSLKGIIPDD